MGKYLRNCNIVIAGKLPSSPSWTKDRVEGWIHNNGGDMQASVNKSTTHLLCSEQHWMNPCSNVKEAQKLKQVKIVSFDWLEDSLFARARKRPEPYFFTDTDGTPQKPQKAKRSPKKIVKTAESSKTEEANGSPKASRKVVKKQKANAKTPAVAPEVIAPPQTNNDRIHVDEKGRQYDVEVPREAGGGSGGKARLQLIESTDTVQPTFCCTVTYISPAGRVTSIRSLAAAGSTLAVAMWMWESFYEHKTKLAWNDAADAIVEGQ